MKTPASWNPLPSPPASHLVMQLRSPLTATALYVELIARKDQSPSTRDYLVKIKQSIDRTEDMIQQILEILDFSPSALTPAKLLGLQKSIDQIPRAKSRKLS
jgi:signal transduction histidine kinase